MIDVILNSESENIMRKTAYTLAETLLTLGIIGVVAALLLPAVKNLRPDNEKVMEIKAYDSLTSIVKTIASNSAIYPVSDNNNLDYTKYPLLNPTMPVDRLYNGDNKYVGTNKFCELLGDNLGVEASNRNCSSTIYNYSDASFNDNISFTTKNGMQWIVALPALDSINITSRKASWQRDVYVDVNGTAGKNCIYNSATCTKPDRFKFIVSPDGVVTPADPMSIMYRDTRRSMTGRTANISAGDNVISGVLDRNSDIEIDRFSSASEGDGDGDGDGGLENSLKPKSREEKCLEQGSYWNENACYQCCRMDLYIRPDDRANSVRSLVFVKKIPCNTAEREMFKIIREWADVSDYIIESGKYTIELGEKEYSKKINL